MSHTRLTLTFTAMVAFAMPPAAYSQTTDWRWFSTCDSTHLMTVEIALRGKDVYNLSFPFCRADRSFVQDQRVVTFSFKSDESITWDKDLKTGPGKILDGNIWEAGGDSDAVLLGVSFAAGEHELLNTIHVAKVAVASRSQLAEGLVLTTHPAPPRRAPRKLTH